MFRKLTLTIFSVFAIVAAASAQMTTTIAVDEFSSEDSLVPFRKLLTEYVVTELASCNLIKVVGYDGVNALKAKLKISDLKACDDKKLAEVTDSLKANVLCVGSVTRNGTDVTVEITIFKDGAKNSKKATATMKSIENTDDAAKNLAEQIESIVKGTEIKAAAPVDPSRSGAFIVPGTPAAESK